MNGKRSSEITLNTIDHPSAFMVERLLDNSNLEMDWWWAAGEAAEPQERRYCLLRALAINPDNQDIAAELAALERSLRANERELGSAQTLRPLFRWMFGQA